MSNQLFEHDYIHDSTVATILQYIIVGVSVFARPSTSIHLGLREFFFLQSNEIGGNGWRVQSCSVFWSFHIIRHSISLRTKWATTERLNTTIEKLFLTWAYTEASGTTFDSEPSPYIFKLWFYKKRTTRELELIYGITKYGLQMIKVVKTSMPIHKL